MASSIAASSSSAAANCMKNEEQMETNEKNEEFDAGKYSKAALATVMLAIKKSNELPFDKDDYDYYASFKGFRNAVNLESKRMRSLMERIILQQGSKVNLAVLELDEMFDILVDANDSILERVGTAVDDALGYRKKVDPVIMTTVQKRLDVTTSWNRKIGGKADSSNCDTPGAVTYRLLAGRNVQRPQLKFKDKIDNSRNPFVPIIKEKPNSLKPLAIILEPADYSEMYSHPYQCELDHFKVPEACLKKPTPQKSKPLKDTPLNFVDSVEKLQEMSSILTKQTEFAVDLEHHSYRTFQGITCLMQVSTRDADYIIDTLELRSDLQVLNESFTDPKIVKVFHGADKDVEWLQRDLGLYVVNMFDTGQAARVLSFSQYSLAFLLKHYCNVDADKQYQLADWRIRPLPDNMVNYAREDTHYLLYIYDRLRTELLDKGNAENNLLLSVFQRSKLLCEKRYVKPVFHSEVYLELYNKSRKVFNTRQLYALRELHAWRDTTARNEDESTGYVLPNHMLLQISEVLPREQQGILACCNPIPTLIRQNLNNIHLIILKAREQSLVKTVEQDLQIEVDARRHQVDLDNVLHCPHDFRPYNDTCDSGLTIMDLWNKHGDEHFQSECVSTKRALLKRMPQLSALVSDDMEKQSCDVDSAFKSYCSPFQRYALVRSALKDVSSSSSSTTTSNQTSKNQSTNPVDSVRQHFMDLVRVHGGGADRTVSNEKVSKASSSKQGSLKRKQVDDAVAPAENEPIRKKVDRDETVKATKRDKRMKNKKRQKREYILKKAQQKTSVGTKEESLPPEMPKHSQNNDEEKLPKLKKISVTDVDEKVQTTKVTPETPKTPAMKEKKNKRVPVVEVTTTNEATNSFKPFDYSQANFEAFKGGSRKKNSEDFNPNGGASKNKVGIFKSKRFGNKRRSGNMSSTYTATAKSNKSSGPKSNWPKL